MAELKTKPNDRSVEAFIATVGDPDRRRDCRTICDLLGKITRQKATMWGDSIVGFGSYHYKYPSGQEGDWFITGFSPRKQNLTLYFPTGVERPAELMAKLGKYKTSGSCLYIRRLADVDLDILAAIIKAAAKGTPTGATGAAADRR